MDSRELVFVREGTVRSPTDDSQWAGDAYLRSNFLKAYDRDVSVNGVSAVGPYTGRNYVSLRNRAFTGWDNPVSNVIIHELIHASGAAGNMSYYQDGFYNGNKEPIRNPKTNMPISGTGGPIMRKPNHDLEWLREKYETIVNSCSK